MKKSISIIVPCFNEEENIELFFQETTKAMGSISSLEYEIIFINDGSRDNTGEKVKSLRKKSSRIGFIDFSRNFGKEAAMLAGLEHAGGDAVVIMDADLQDPPSLIPQMVQEWRLGYDIVYTRRVSREGEPVIRSWFARNFYKIMNRMSEVEIVDGARDFRIMDRKVVDSILLMREKLRFSKGLFAWVGFSSKCLEYENINRKAGETGWSFKKLLDYAIEGIVSFSYMPLRFASITGLSITLLAFLYMIYLIVDKLLFGNPVPGYPSLASFIIFLGGVQLLFLGIIGEYLGRIFYELKARPHYITQENLPGLLAAEKINGQAGN
ncbi:glycosyltransferase family 2 protein [Candidatus Contubernalis alkaliaceticus]|uniref:glycosyltransferase family 2 protein n=1 Tax=Candidatus Contubernalis alkaliaceticus TaxID=338645 RepID=UPI001F4C459A|nr:glycosyltransferase family 2 protein [Candidatus Contubernalis alkalaceticus]UNC93484.1 glycosyltransferase family 2 protein [Candidatus Contubernalis alkalaceticus]